MSNNLDPRADAPSQETPDEIGLVIHEMWSMRKRVQGHHGPHEPCTTGALADRCSYRGSGIRYWFRCHKFHSDLIPWNELGETQKDINRHAADALLQRGVLVTREQADRERDTAVEKMFEATQAAAASVIRIRKEEEAQKHNIENRYGDSEGAERCALRGAVCNSLEKAVLCLTIADV